MANVTVAATDTFDFGDVPIAGAPGPLQAVPKFPLSLAATRDLLNWSNFFPSQPVPTLAADVGPTDETVALTAGTGDQFPADNFEVSVDDEIIFVTARSGDALTGCVRGAELSAAAAHLTGATVQLLITALAHNLVVAELVEVEQLLGPRGVHIFPAEVALAPGAGGDFAVAHGLGVTPRYATVQMASGGAIWFQAVRYDDTYLYLVASDGGVVGIALVWI